LFYLRIAMIFEDQIDFGLSRWGPLAVGEKAAGALRLAAFPI